MFFTFKFQVAVAVKTLKTGSTVEEKLDFLGEADMMKRFDHKNIVKLLGVCTRNEPIYTVMEFMLYGDLKTYLLARYLITIFFHILCRSLLDNEPLGALSKRECHCYPSFVTLWVFVEKINDDAKN